MNDAPMASLLPKKDDGLGYRPGGADDIIFRPDYKPATELLFGDKVQGLGNAPDFEKFN